MALTLPVILDNSINLLFVIVTDFANSAPSLLAFFKSELSFHIPTPTAAIAATAIPIGFANRGRSPATAEIPNKKFVIVCGAPLIAATIPAVPAAIATGPPTADILCILTARCSFFISFALFSVTFVPSS